MKTSFIFLFLITLTSCNGTGVENTETSDLPKDTEIVQTETLGETSDKIAETPSIVAEEIYAEDMLNAETLITGTANSELSEIEKTSLIYMREEEKLARDVYLTLYDTWGQQIFSNISGSEQTHTDAVKTLLEKYSISDPMTDDTIGVFVSPILQGLYDSLVVQGKTSLLDALIVGATIEDLDIKDLQDASEQIDKEDILLVYANLERGSRNHLRSFIQNITRFGGVYTAQYISQEDYDQIISSEKERGGNTQNSTTRGGKAGMGNGKNQ